METQKGYGDKYERAKAERQRCVEAVLNSAASKKIVVAGPGTGKTFLFKKVLEGKSKTLTLSFVNSLVEDLSLELCGLSDVRTLHGFALHELGGKAKVHPKLSLIVRHDAQILLNASIDFERLFHDRHDEHEHLKFYKARKDYYAHYGFADIVYAIVKAFEKKPERVPRLQQVVVDEFQDFSKLEVSLIDLLADRNPILIAGDDDQALYHNLKGASAEHIRKKHDTKTSGYAAFTLPYCSRCTGAIVRAANDVINVASGKGLLRGRIKKAYEYFVCREKDAECERNPKLIYRKVFAKQVPWFIEQQLGQLAEEVKDSFSVLIISPTTTQSRHIVKSLKKKGLSRIDFVDRKERDVTLLDGLRLILSDKACNLGWRIVSKFLLEEDAFAALLKQTAEEGADKICNLVGTEVRKEVAGLVKLLKAIQDERKISPADMLKLYERLGLDLSTAAGDRIRDEIGSAGARPGNPAIRKIPVKATTIQSSKGLAAQYVFITHFDDRFFIKADDKANISDQDICNFLVALTRAKRRVYLISTADGEPTFLQWINGDVIDRETETESPDAL